MKTSNWLIPALIISMSLTGCSAASQPAVTVTATETVTAQPEEEKTETAETAEEDVEDQSDLSWESSLRVELVEFSVSKADCSYSDGSLEMRATITNISGRDIVAIDAAAIVNDVFGEQIKGLNISSDKRLLAGESVNVGSWGSSCYDLNQFSSDDNRLLDMEDLEVSTSVEFQIQKIAFADGEIAEY